ncbi:MAG: GNAT family N-acetyltransferase [Fidelibacterota bacterium]
MPIKTESIAYLPTAIQSGSLSAQALLEQAQMLADSVNRNEIHTFLSLGHIPTVNRFIVKNNLQEEWFQLLNQLITQSQFDVFSLLQQRVTTYAGKCLFQTINGDQVNAISYQEAWDRILLIGTKLVNIHKISPITVGILSPNCLNGALVDLACLAFRIPVVPIPVNLAPNHLQYVLNHSQVSHLFIGGNKPYQLLEESRVQFNGLEIIHLKKTHPAEIPGLEWDSLLSQVGVPDPVVEPNINIKAPASVMYTSGTTDKPKGIIFSQLNIISKRFARALALPELGSEDRFLCYLPLYHTFGRFFELLGTIFWGATYAFAESTSFKSLLKDFKIAKPTIFISIPKRWIQIQEQVSTMLSLERSSDKEIQNTVRKITGGSLKWGLSAAGYMDPDIFQFFQRYGIKLMSGYGMTEATGGITMTPPNNYLPDSVGKKLPGIEIKLAADSELLLRGSYVSPGYFKSEDSETFKNGWFHTGDIFREKKGHYFIIDRKKEIYKNSRGQTISPQKIENLFQDFDAFKSVFLVGDGREFNTLLIYPDTENIPLDLTNTSDEELRTYFSSLVFSVNTFLAPYERIVNYAVIHRDFDGKHGELTPKGTFKRKVILEHFSKIIEPMYARNFISLIQAENEILIPNWLLREKGLVRGDISWDKKMIRGRKQKKLLPLFWGENKIQIGDFVYSNTSHRLNLEKFIRAPELWLGNQAIVNFVGNPCFRITAFEPFNELQLIIEQLPFRKHNFPESTKPSGTIKRPEQISLKFLNRCAIHSFSNNETLVLEAINGLKLVLTSDSIYRSFAENLLLRLQHYPELTIRLRALEVLLPKISGEMFIDLLQNIHRFADQEKQTSVLSWNPDNLLEPQLYATLKLLAKYRQQNHLDAQLVSFSKVLINLLSIYGIRHPGKFSLIRSELSGWITSTKHPSLKKEVQIALDALIQGFRTWLGPPVQLAIDRETGKEYTWNDVILFDNNISTNLQNRLMESISNTTLIREAVFLFSGRFLIQLEDIQLNGIWISLLGKAHGKIVVRVLIQTRDLEAFNLVINLNDSLTPKQIETEVYWLIVTGSSFHGPKLVEDFGGYWPKYGLYTEEYISGETVQQYLERNCQEIQSRKFPDRWQMRWLHFIWNGITAYLEFWKRTGCQFILKDASVRNLIIPKYDYTIGTRLISISNRKKESSLGKVLIGIYRQYIMDSEAQFEGLQKMAGWEILFTVVIEIFGKSRGIELLKTMGEELNAGQLPELLAEGLSTEKIIAFIEDLSTTGLITKQVVFAALRYERWLDLNPEATLEARGTILQELYKDYHLRSVAERYPETRLRFYLMTAFKDTNPALIKQLNRFMYELRQGSIREDDLTEQLHHLQDFVDLTKEERYFLTRLVFEHVDAAEYAELVSADTGLKGRLDLVVLVEDTQGEQYRIRPPFHPKEVARFHRLLLEANLAVRFQVQHEFLLIYNWKNHLIGGVFWKKAYGKTAYLEKVVITAHYRKRYLSIKLIEELAKRLRSKGVEHLTVGFFQAGLFYKLGFQIDKQFGGLVKHLK